MLFGVLKQTSNSCFLLHNAAKRKKNPAKRACKISYRKEIRRDLKFRNICDYSLSEKITGAAGWL